MKLSKGVTVYSGKGRYSEDMPDSKIDEGLKKAITAGNKSAEKEEKKSSTVVDTGKPEVIEDK